jgi:hypothetical protein
VSGRDLTGWPFTIPAPIAGLREGDRVALAAVGAGTADVGPDRLAYDLRPGSVDLSWVRTGRCPLLTAHARHPEALLGQVLEGRLAGDRLEFLVRFAPTRAADEMWTLIEAGFPLSLSAGAEILHADRVGPDRYRATRWRPMELSIVTHGADRAAHVRRLEGAEDVEAFAAGGDRERVRAALHLDDWTAWTVPAAARIAARLGADREAVLGALGEEVEEHCRALERDLAL